MQLRLAEQVDQGLASIQIHRTGTFKDPRYGKFDVSEKHFSEMIKNFEEGVRGVVPSIDYAHESDGPSAGWLKKLYTKKGSDGVELWGDFSLTPRGQKSLADREYAYTSADYDEEYVDNETGKKHGCVLKGLAFTNRPVIKRMRPAVQLSEISTEEEGMSDETKMKDLEKRLSELETKNKDLQEKLDAKGSGDKASETERQLSEAKELTKQLMEKAAKLEKEASFTRLLSEGKAVAAQKEAFMSGDMEAFAKLSQPMKTETIGHGGGAGGEKTAEDDVSEKAMKLSEENKISIKEATAQILRSDRSLAEKTGQFARG